MYSLKVWQKAITDFSSSIDVCGVGLKSSCLWNLGLDQCYEDGIVRDCDSSCLNGCAIQGTCFQCSDLTCSECTDYNDTCTSNNNDPCLIDTWLASTSRCCYPNCTDCYGSLISMCKSCIEELYYMNQTCVPECPFGYTVSGKNCIQSLTKIIDIQLDVILDKVISSSSEITFTTGYGTEFYLNRTSYDPVPAFQRGYFFKSTSFMTSTDFILSSNFTMIFYIKQLTGGIVIEKNTLKISTVLNIALIFNTLTYKYSEMIENTWVILSVQVFNNFDGYLISTVTLGNSISQSNSLLSGYFSDTISSLTIGSSSESFTGFLWKYQLYTIVQPIDNLSIRICTSDLENNCVNNCDLDFFYNKSTKICDPCSEECTDGCKNSTSCGLCADPYCIICNSYNTNSCYQCEDLYIINNHACESCSNGFYYNYIEKNCSECNSLCAQCDEKAYCLQCIENSSVNDDDQICYCNKGYAFEEKECRRNRFKASITISLDNMIKMIFTEPLEKDLENDDIQVYADGEIQEFQLKFLDSKSYQVNISFASYVPENAKLKITIPSDLISKENSLILDSVLKGNLFELNQDIINNQVEDIKEISQKAIIAVTSVAFGVSTMNFNPVAIFNLLNTLEIFYYALLFNIQIEAELQVFLDGLKIMSGIPNPVSFMITSSNFHDIPEKLSQSGYTTNTFLLNSGISLTVLVCYLFLYLLCFIFYKIISWTWAKTQMKKILVSIKFRFFIRFWIQTNLEFLINCPLSIFYNKLNSILSIIDFTISCAAIVIYIQIFEFTGFFMLIRAIFIRKKIQLREEKTFLEQYGTFFNEFRLERESY